MGLPEAYREDAVRRLAMMTLQREHCGAVCRRLMPLLLILALCALAIL